MRLDWKNIGAGLTYGLFGALGLILGRELPMGDAAAMGPGYVPRMVSVALVGIGAILVFRGTLRSRSAIRFPAFSWGINTLVLGSVMAFAATLERAGLIAATGVLVVVSVFAGEKPRAKETLALIAALSTLVVLVFVYGLGVHMRVWPW
jgi:hypothetical protein